MEFTSDTRVPGPRIREDDIAVRPPPDVRRAGGADPLTRLLPVAMIVAGAGMLVLWLRSGDATMRSPMSLLFPAMMLVSALGALAYGMRGSGRASEIDQDRRDYLRYLATLDTAAAQTAAVQRTASCWTDPEPDSLWTLAGTPRMWERRPGDPDFGSARIGRAPQRLSTRLVVPDLAAADASDPVTVAALQRVIVRRAHVSDLPFAVAICGFRRVSVDGDAESVHGLIRAVVCQLATWHSPGDLRIAAVVGTPADVDDWDWLKWLPHHQHPVATDGAGAARLTYSTMAQAELALQHPDIGGPVHVVLLAPNGCETPADGVTGVTVLTVGNGEAAAAGLRLRIDPDGVSRIDGADEDPVPVHPDRLTPAQAQICARRLARFRAGSSGHGQPRTAYRDWADLMGIADPGRIEPAVLWRPRDARTHLRVPIGLDDDGGVVELDLKEAAQQGMGPHGLCIGATGSGKSEFLRTLTLGLAAAHPPEALNLILVDFKGGATFLGFDRLRHVASVITNLADEAHLVARMRDALAGEMNRRQEALRAAGNVGNIAEYARVRDAGAPLPALPAVLMIVDEFSELLSRHPDFAELFVAIGRLGRSLGMHLLLASQRLDEGRLRGLETHLSYRICLKTFSASDSRAVLGVPDAYHLPGEPGAAYLRSASGELTRFRSAFVSGGRAVTTRPAPAAAAAPVFTATPVCATGPDERGPGDDAGAVTVLDAVLDRLAGHGTAAHPVWLAPLRESPPLDAVLPMSAAPLTVAIGLTDRPFDQRRDPHVVDLAGAQGNVAVVGGPRAGKSTAVRTLLLALAATHPPAEVQMYCLDFGGGALSAMRALPHVGSVAGRLDVDLVRRTVAELESLMCSRDALFRRLGIDSIGEYRRRRAAGDTDCDDGFGDVFLVVDGWAGLRHEFDTLENSVSAIAAQGLSFGIHVVIAASRWSEIRPAIKDQLGTRIELRLGDPAESEMDRRLARGLGDCPAGRGITRTGHEFVIALPRLDGRSAAEGLGEAIAAAGEVLHTRHPDRHAPPVRLLPAHVRYEEVAERVGRRRAGRLLLGLGERELQPMTVDLVEQPHLLMLGEPQCGKTAALRTLCTDIVGNHTAGTVALLMVDYRRTLLGVVESSHLFGYAMSAVTLAAQVADLLGVLTARLPGAEVTQRQLRDRSWWSGPEIYVVVDDYDLVAAAAGNPLGPLGELVPHAADLGLHMVVARRSGGAARALFDPMLTQLREQGCAGLMMSANPDEGPLLGSVRPSLLPPGRATLLTRGGPPQLIQVGWTDPP
ncbi:MAG: type VII secretion protein EccCa [Actinobacteria bacterium]|nr:type VII secretion protein EccCa [Actinomycetota bacterium]